MRFAVEVGVDVVKTPYCGDMKAYAQIVADCPAPLVAAGGPKADTLRAALEMASQVVRSGARGATIGRNIWGFPQIEAAVSRLQGGDPRREGARRSPPTSRPREVIGGQSVTAITPRERLLKAIRHEQPDRVPWHFTFTAPARKKAESHYGNDNLDDVLGNHLAAYRPQAAGAWREIRPGHWRDEFGVVWNRTVDKDVGVVEDSQLKTRSLAEYAFPDPHDPRRYEKLPAFLAAQSHRFRYVSVAFSLFERAWSLRGMTDLMVDMLEAPEFVDELLDAIAAFNCGILEETLRYDIDGVKFGDDWGQQNGLIFGGRLWHRFIKPRLAQMYGMVKLRRQVRADPLLRPGPRTVSRFDRAGIGRLQSVPA